MYKFWRKNARLSADDTRPEHDESAPESQGPTSVLPWSIVTRILMQMLVEALCEDVQCMKVVGMFSDSSWTIILIDIVGSDQVCVLYASSYWEREKKARVDVPVQVKPVCLRVSHVRA